MGEDEQPRDPADASAREPGVPDSRACRSSLAKGSAVYNAGCGNLFKPPFVANGNNSAFTVSWNGAAGDYYIALKLDSSSVRGEPAPPTPIHYEYSATGVAASTAGIDLAPR